MNRHPEPTIPDIKVGDINHEYGGLLIRESSGRYFWSIEANTFSKWQEITKELYDALAKFKRV